MPLYLFPFSSRTTYTCTPLSTFLSFAIVLFSLICTFISAESCESISPDPPYPLGQLRRDFATYGLGASQNIARNWWIWCAAAIASVRNVRPHPIASNIPYPPGQFHCDFATYGLGASQNSAAPRT